MKQQTFSEALATEGTEFTERFFLLPSTRQPLLHPGYVQMGKNLRLCVLCDLCGRTLLVRGCPKGQWRSKLAVGVAIGIEGPWDGIRPRETGSSTAWLRC